MIAIALVAFQWLVVELFGATGNLESLSIAALNVSLAVVLALPLIELTIHALVEAIWPDDPEQEQALRAAHRETQHGLIRCGRTITAVVPVIILARVWGLDLRDVASQGMGAQLAGALSRPCWPAPASSAWQSASAPRPWSRTSSTVPEVCPTMNATPAHMTKRGSEASSASSHSTKRGSALLSTRIGRLFSLHANRSPTPLTR